MCLKHHVRGMVGNANRNRDKAVSLTISFTVTTGDKILDRSALK